MDVCVGVAKMKMQIVVDDILNLELIFCFVGRIKDQHIFHPQA